MSLKKSKSSVVLASGRAVSVLVRLWELFDRMHGFVFKLALSVLSLFFLARKEDLATALKLSNSWHVDRF